MENDLTLIEQELVEVKHKRSNQHMELSKKRKRSESPRAQVKICNVCGSRGFSNALVYCSQCSSTLVHQYCVGIPPGNLDDIYNWVCEYCAVVKEAESCTCHAFDSASSERHPESCIVHAEALIVKNESAIMVIPDQPEPVCVLYPVTIKGSLEHEETRSRSQTVEEQPSTASVSLHDMLDYREGKESPISSFMEYPEWLMDGVVLVVCPSGEIIICSNSDISDEFSSQNAGGSVSIRYVTYGEEPKALLSSFMEYPEEINGELVLLVKPTGEIVIDYGVSSHDDFHFCGSEAAMHNMVDRSGEINSGNLDEVIDRYGDFAYGCCMVDVEPICVLRKGNVVWHSDGFSKINIQSDGYEYMFDASEDMEGNIQLSNEGSESKHQMSHKTTSFSTLYDYLPPIKPECKRARRKRYKISPSPIMKVGVCQVDVCGAEELQGRASGYNQGTKSTKMKSLSSLITCSFIPPLKSNCKRARSKRWQRFDKLSKAGICAPGYF